MSLTQRKQVSVMADKAKEDEKTPTDSQAVNNTQDSDSGNLLKDTEQQTQEEAEWSSLKGPTQERIRQLIDERNEARQERDRVLKTDVQYTPNVAQPNPNVEDALHKLSSAGVALKDDVKKEVNDGLASIRYQMELDRLEDKFGGNDGRPKFDRTEYEDYVNRHPEYRGYFPEDVYQKMYREELRDWESSHEDKRTISSRSVRPTKTATQEETLTPESIEARLKEPDGREWYDRNISKINRVLGNMGK